MLPERSFAFLTQLFPSYDEPTTTCLSRRSNPFWGSEYDTPNVFPLAGYWTSLPVPVPFGPDPVGLPPALCREASD